MKEHPLHEVLAAMGEKLGTLQKVSVQENDVYSIMQKRKDTDKET